METQLIQTTPNSLSSDRTKQSLAHAYWPCRIGKNKFPGQNQHVCSNPLYPIHIRSTRLGLNLPDPSLLLPPTHPPVPDQISLLKSRLPNPTDLKQMLDLLWNRRGGSDPDLEDLRNTWCIHIRYLHVDFCKTSRLKKFLVSKLQLFKYFRMVCWYPKIKSTENFGYEYTILFVISPSLVPHVNINKSLLLNFRMACRYPKISVHKNYKF